MKLSLFIAFFTTMTVSANVDALSQRVNLNFRDAELREVFRSLKEQTGYMIIFSEEEMGRVAHRVTIDKKDVELGSALSEVLRGAPYTYSIEDQMVVIIPAKGQTQNTQQPEGEFTQVKGRVVDEKGNPLPRVTVMVHGTAQGVNTDGRGEYIIRVKPNSVMVFSHIGYKEETVLYKGGPRMDVTLNSESESLGEVTVVAFGTQSKGSVVGAVTSVNPMDLKTSSSDFTSGFIGKVAGIIGYQQSGLPAALKEEDMNTKFYIRGITSFNSNANTDPLIILDGVEISKLDLSRLAPEDIETYSVLKDAAATAMYGARGANGVLLVTTKKGVEGSVYTTARYESIVSMPTREIDVVNPIDYMRYYNQAIMERSPGATPRYSVERINRTASGKYPSWVYPANDWYDVLFKKQTFNQHAGVTVRGGSNIIQYYASVNYNHDSGMLKTDRLNQFDVNIKNNQLGFRTNLNIDLKSGIKLVINSSATMDRYHGPLIDAQSAYSLAFNVSPVDFAPTYPADDQYGWPHIRFGIGSGGTASGTNPYSQTQKGYSNQTRFSTINRAEYIHNLSSLVKGLELRLSASLVQSSYGSQDFTTKPYHYYMSDYDQETGKHTLVPDPGPFGGNLQSSRTLQAGSRSTTSDTRITYEGRVYHNASWGDHQTSVTGVMQMYERTFSPIPDVLNGLPQRNLSYSGRVSYGYKNRYFAEGSFAYNGSERFAKNNRMGFFPAIGGTWVVSNENWMNSLQEVVPYLKLRFSWGKVGNDGIINTPRYVYLPTLGTIEMDGIKDLVPNPTDAFDRKTIIAYPNEGIQWEIAETVNWGIDATFLKGLLEIQADIYQEKRHNIISERLNLPAYLGVETPPLDNIGRTLSRGVDLSGKIQHQFSNDLWMILNGTLTYNKTTYDYIDEPIDKPAWQRKKGREISQQMGYIAEGLFRDQAEIDNAPRQDGDVMPGDIRYRDINSDGVIDVEDAVFIGYPEMPRMVYGFDGLIFYKNFEFSFAFQGSSKRTFFINPAAISPFNGDHAMLQAIADSHWSATNMDRNAFWPRLSTNSITQHNPYEDWYNKENVETRKSTYFMRECTFLRCRSISLAYNIPKRWMQKMRLQNAKVTVSTNNPFMITDFKLWDVELGENGFNYPIQKTYSVGLSVSF